MGRGKLDLRLIEKEKTRYNTFQKRKGSLFKKAHEFKVLCDVDVCVVIYGPRNPNTNMESIVETWPTDDATVQRIVRSYTDDERRSNDNDGTVARRTTDLSSFFRERSKKANDKLVKLRRKAGVARFPEWDSKIEEFGSEHLKEVHALLNAKIVEIRGNLEMAKWGKKEQCHNNQLMNIPHQTFVSPINYMPPTLFSNEPLPEFNVGAMTCVPPLHFHDSDQMPVMHDENSEIPMNWVNQIRVDNGFDAGVMFPPHDIANSNDVGNLCSGNAYEECGGAGIFEEGMQFLYDPDFFYKCGTDIVGDGDLMFCF